MNRRDVPTLRLGDDDVSKALQGALDAAVDDEFPGVDRLQRVEAHVLSEVALTGGELSGNQGGKPLGSEWGRARSSGWRPPLQPRIRFAAAKVGIAALVGMSAAWSSVAGYRAFQAATARAAKEPPVSPAPPTSQHRRAPLATAAAPVDDIASPQEPPPLAMARDESVAHSVEELVRADDHPSPAIVRPAPSGASDKTAPSNASTVAPPSAGARSSLGVAAPKPYEDMPPTATPAPLGDMALPGTPAPSSTFAASTTRTLEEDLLERATRALRADPQKALAIAEEHRATFGSGRLAQEREVVAIQALAKLRQYDAARARAQRFLAEHPESPYAKDVLRMAAAR